MGEGKRKKRPPSLQERDPSKTTGPAGLSPRETTLLEMNSAPIADKEWKFLWQKEKGSGTVSELALLPRKYTRALRHHHKKNILHLLLLEKCSQGLWQHRLAGEPSG